MKKVVIYYIYDGHVAPRIFKTIESTSIKILSNSSTIAVKNDEGKTLFSGPIKRFTAVIER